MTGECVDVSVSARIPQMYEFIISACSQHPSIGTDRYSQNMSNVPLPSILGILPFLLLLLFTLPLSSSFVWCPASPPQALPRL